VHFASRKAEPDIGPPLSIDAQKGTPFKIISNFPERKQFVREDGWAFRVGDRAELWLRSFEVLMLEVTPEKGIVGDLPIRKASAQQVAPLGIPLTLRPVRTAKWMSIHFADADRFEKEGRRKMAFAFESTLPSL